MPQAPPAARLFRFLPGGSLPGPDLIAIYDEAKNLVIIDKELFDELDTYDQRAIERITKPNATIVRRHGKPPRVEFNDGGLRAAA